MDWLKPGSLLEAMMMRRRSPQAMMTGIKTSITRDKRPGKYIMLPDTLGDDEMILVYIAMIQKIMY